MQTQNVNKSLIAIAVAGALAAGYAGFKHGAESPKPATETPPAAAAAPSPAPVAVAPAALAPVAANLPDFAGIVEESGPAVVNISISGQRKVANAEPDEDDSGDPMAPFFRRFQPPSEGEAPPVRGQGSGFVVRPDGVILTNAHVVDGAKEVTVKLADRREFTAKVIGIDKPTDTAVLKIDADGLPTVRLGSPGKTGVGEWVLAIGSPFGFENTVTAGIVSAKSRSLPEEGYVPFIQTDVAVNPGNSGGPLLNARGEVIGINSQIYSRTGGYQGLSFAIPIDVAMKVEQQLLDKGRVSRGRLGVGVQDLTPALAESFGLPKPEGALVGQVPPDGPAAKAGIQPGDVILALDGQPVRDSKELPPRVADIKPGTDANLTIWRDRKPQEVTLKVGELDQPEAQAAKETPEAAKGRLGLAVRPLSPEERQEAGVKNGVLVAKVAGPAAKAGIQPGDLILSFNGQPITEVEQLRDLADKAGKRVAILIQRGGNAMFVPVDLG
jgi:serine protease Do